MRTLTICQAVAYQAPPGRAAEIEAYLHPRAAAYRKNGMKGKPLMMLPAGSQVQNYVIMEIMLCY